MTTTTTKTDYDVIVLGVGAMGSSACYHLAKRGQRVLGLEQFGPAHNRGSSHGKTRMVRKAYFEHPDYVPLLRRSYELWDELGASVGRPLFHRSGVVIFGPETKPNADDMNVLAGVQASAKQHDLPLEVLSRDACHARFPYFRVPEGYIGLFEADAGYVEVEASVAAHIEEARKLGADLRFDEAVLSWDAISDNVVSVRTASRTYTAAKLVVTTGAWSSSMLRSASLDLKVHRVPLFWFAPAPNENGRALATTPNMPCFAIDLPCGFVYGFPYVDGDGLKIASHLPGAVLDDPSSLYPGVLPGELDPVAECVSTCFPGLLPTPTTSATCMYTMSKDGHFIIDAHPAHPNVVFAAGFSGHGYKFAPVIGEILSDLAVHGSTDHPIGFLRRR